MKSLVMVTSLFLTLTTYANYTADLLCTSRGLSDKLVADSKGVMEVVQKENGEQVFLTLDLRLFSDFGTQKGSEFKNLQVNGEVVDGNDRFYLIVKPSNENKIIEEIVIDFSTVGKEKSFVKTKKGNLYNMDCLVRIH